MEELVRRPLARRARARGIALPGVLAIGALIGLVAAVGGPALAAEVHGGGLRFEPTITLGHLISAVMLMATIAVGYAKLMSEIAVLKVKMEELWSDRRQRRHIR